MKKYICLLLIVFTVLSCFTCCSKEPAENETTVIEETLQQETTQAPPVIEREITVGYYAGKSLNPFKTDSPINLNLSTLFYDSLFVCESDYTAEPLIAVSSVNKGKKVVVELDTQAQFSKGSQITAQDVVYSFNLAKKSTFYKNRLSNFTYAVEGDDSVTFVLAKPDVFAENCLNFPVVKYGTGDDSLPTGSGRYVIRKDDKGLCLVANENSTHGEVMSTPTIRLSAVDASDGELYMLQTGDISYFFEDLTDSEVTKIGANMMQVPLNNLVYLGFNSKNEFLKNKNAVDAIEYAVDKITIADVAYNGMCRITSCIFNPDWEQLSKVTLPEWEYSPVKAGEILDDSGYVFAYDNNAYRSKNFKFIELKLIVNTENPSKLRCAKLIAKNLESIGVNVNVTELTYEEYQKALAEEEFDLYVGEVKLSPNMDLSCFFTENGGTSYGIDTNSTVAKAATDLSTGNVDVNTFVQVFNEDKPFLPICYRDGMAYFSREITFEGSVSEYEPFKNIYSWEIGENQLPQTTTEEATEEATDEQQ